MKNDLAAWRSELRAELTENILPFWLSLCPDDGPITGRVDGEGRVHAGAGLSAVLLARMLWFFSAAYRAVGDRRALDAARRVWFFLSDNLIDRRYGGVYWELSHNGLPLGCKKQSYAAGFAIYGLCEYALASGDMRAADEARALFGSLEEHAYDTAHDGYVEAFARDWQPLDDMRLSAKDSNTAFSMNTHLHLLEAYTALSKVRPSERVSDALHRLLRIHTDRIFDPSTGHLNLFFDRGWRAEWRTVSFGHDIEASWLIDEAAAAAGTSSAKAASVTEALAAAAVEGLQPDGSMIYEYDPATGRTDADRHWWVQAESVVGLFNMYQRTGDERFLRRSRDAWRYISGRLVDRLHSEWLWSVRADGSENRTDDKAGFWKCPYHNGRMCMELAARIDRLAND